MRPVRSLVIYLVLVFAGGALLAPWLYWLVADLAAHSHSRALTKLASNPFHRYLGRALLSGALIGLWPLLRSCRMLHWRDLGLVSNRWLKDISIGFLLGLGSLACVALLGISFGGRSFNGSHSSQEMLGHLASATTAAIIVSVLEEILFRSALFGILRKSIPCSFALIISSAVYALVHFLKKSESSGTITWLSGLELLPKMFQAGPHFIPTVLTLFVAGTILALAYLRTGALFLSMGLHAGWIFWLKSYGFFTLTKAGANPSIWGSDSLLDGWLPLFILIGLLLFVSKLRRRTAETA